jgi:lipoate-protein ligase A
MGLDEALIESVSGSASPPVLRFFGWKPQTVSVGYFQRLADEVDLDACARTGTDVVRRISGGGAVFHHAEVTYSMTMPLNHPLAGQSIRESYGILCAGVIRGLELLGVSAYFAPINDILAENRKVSGNAQTRRMGCLLQHGTILLDLDADLMFELLKVPPEKIQDKTDLIQNVKDRVTSLSALLKRTVSYEEAETALAEGFKQALSLEFSECSANPSEAENAKALAYARNKFAAPEWLHKK